VTLDAECTWMQLDVW